MLTAEEMTENFNQFRDLLSKIGDRSESALKLVDHFGERLALCPASSKRSYHNSFAGGLVDHSLRVCKNAVVMMKSYCEQSEWKSMKDSVILTSLFHDIGKAGDLTNDYYVPAEEWRRQKLGEDYAVNENFAIFGNAGPYLAINLFDKAKAEGDILDEYEFDDNSTNVFGDDAMKRFDFGLGLKAGVEFSQKYQISIGYDWGLVENIKDSGNKNRNLMISLSCFF
jgi:hypothetical protein